MPFIISQSDKYQAKLTTLLAAGASSLQVIADFDQTMTKATVNGQKVRSSIAILREQGYLGQEYSQAAQALADHYIPIEQDSSLDQTTKSAAMMEWWQKHYDLLKQSGLQAQHLQTVVDSGWLVLRPLVPETLRLLADRQIPLVILSANGLGQNIIELLLAKQQLLTDNIIIISNKLEWGQAGNFIGVKPPIIHSCNKAETSLADHDSLGLLHKRNQILLLGDGLHDIEMAQGLHYQNLLAIGFYNQADRSLLPDYQQIYDALITADNDFGAVHNIIQQLS